MIYRNILAYTIVHFMIEPSIIKLLERSLLSEVWKNQRNKFHGKTTIISEGSKEASASQLIMKNARVPPIITVVAQTVTVVSREITDNSSSSCNSDNYDDDFGHHNHDCNREHHHSHNNRH